MKKILVLINDYKVPITALNFAVQTAVQNEASLFGIFAQGLKYNNDIAPFASNKNVTDKHETTATIEEEHLKFLDASIKLFAATCEEANVDFKTHTINANHLETLIDYSAFADLIVCDAATL
jgi:hypothetical protein